MDFNAFSKELDKVLQYLEEQFGSLQVGKANPKMVENLEVYVPSYGQSMKISGLASVTIMDAQTLKVEAWDKSSLSSIDKGIQDANIGLNPTNFGEHLVIKFPILTTERRQQLQKLASGYGEEAKISIRNIRHEHINAIKKQFEAKEVSESDKGSREKKIDETVKEYNKTIETEVKAKQEEMMKI
ncbi:MAG: ribosome recycling factor [Candidatus Absconditabacterales bacterium]